MKFLILSALILNSLTAIAAEKSTPKKSPTYGELLASSQPSDWRTPSPENILYMELPQGRVVIELAPDFAPHHVDNVKALAREKYWDGLAVVRVQDNYVVQWADPNSEKPDKKRKIKSAHETLEAEFDHDLNPQLPFFPMKDKDIYAAKTGFSNGFAVGQDPRTKKMWLLHCYGAVGAGRDVAANSGGGAELYAVIGNAPRHLDRNVTVLGHVISGMEFLSSLPRGHGDLGFYLETEKNTEIRSIRLASDVPEKDRSRLEVLKTDSDLFPKLVEARRHREEEWFHFSAQRLDACNMPIPVREKK